MIRPTIGRVVLFRHNATQIDPFPALVTKVWDDQCINLAGFNDGGTPFSASSCRLIQDDEPAPSFGPYAEWMPYQKAQAAKHDTEVTPKAPAPADSIEAEIQAKGKTAARVTPADVEANIASEHYFTAHQGIQGARAGASSEDIKSLDLLTFCVLVLLNGFTVTGESACANPENFDAEIGKKIARANAVQKIWSLMGYELRTQLARTILEDAGAEILEISAEQAPEHERAGHA